MLGVAPGLPEVCVTRNPDTAPDNACPGLENTPTVNFLLSTLAMELVLRERICVPVYPRDYNFVEQSCVVFERYQVGAAETGFDFY